MTNPYPLPRETRETSEISGDGRATYGPLNFKIWDEADVVALVSRAGAGLDFEAVTIEKVSSQTLDDFSVTFAPALQTGDLAYVQSRRLHERSTDVIRGGALSGAALEAELSRQGTILQELRRDLNRAIALAPGLDALPPIGPLQANRMLAVSADGERFEYGFSTPELIALSDAAEAARDAALLTNGSGARFVFSTETADADPGNGKLRFSNIEQNSATTIRADTLDVNGADVSGLLDAFDNSTSTTKGHIRVYAVADPTKWLTFAVTAVTNPMGYRNITVSSIAASETSPFEDGDSVLLSFVSVGDKGDPGAQGETGTIEFDFNNWIIAGPFTGTGVLSNYPMPIDPGTINNTFVNVGGAAQLISEGAYSLIYIDDDPYIRINVPSGVSFEVRTGSAVSTALGEVADNTFPIVKLKTSEVTPFARTLLDDPDAATMRATLKTAWELIEEKTFSGATATNFLDLGAFRRLRLRGNINVAEAQKLYFKVSSDNGATWLGAASDYVCQFNSYSNATEGHSRITTSAGQLSETCSIGSNQIIDLELFLFNVNGTGRFKGEVVGVGGSLSYYTGDFGGVIAPVAVYNALQILAGTNALITGSLVLEGTR